MCSHYTKNWKLRANKAWSLLRSLQSVSKWVCYEYQFNSQLNWFEVQVSLMRDDKSLHESNLTVVESFISSLYCFNEHISWPLFLREACLTFGLDQIPTVDTPCIISSVHHSCLTLCNPMDCSTPGLPVHHQLPELTQTHVRWVGDAIQPSHPVLFASPPAFRHSQHHSLFQWVSSSHEVAKVLEFQLLYQSFQWIFSTDFL